MENRKNLSAFGRAAENKPLPVSKTVYHTVEVANETGHVPEFRKKIDDYVEQLMKEESERRKNGWNQLFSTWEPVALLDFYINHKIRLAELTKELEDWDDDDEDYRDGLEWNITSVEQLIELARPFINNLFTKEN